MWTLQDLVKASSFMCTKNHWTWENDEHLKKQHLYACNSVLGHVSLQLGFFVLLYRCISSFFSFKQGDIKYHHLIFTGLTTKNNSQAHLWFLSGTKFCAYSYSEHK